MSPRLYGRRELSQVEALRRLLDAPLEGPSYSINEFSKIEGCSRRQTELLIEAGELAAYKDGNRWKIPHAAREDLIRQLEPYYGS